MTLKGQKQREERKSQKRRKRKQKTSCNFVPPLPRVDNLFPLRQTIYIYLVELLLFIDAEIVCACTCTYSVIIHVLNYKKSFCGRRGRQQI